MKTVSQRPTPVLRAVPIRLYGTSSIMVIREALSSSELSSPVELQALRNQLQQSLQSVEGQIGQSVTSVPWVVRAANAGAVAASGLSGTLSAVRLPAGVSANEQATFGSIQTDGNGFEVGVKP